MLINLNYGYIGYLIGEERMDEVESYVEKTERLIDEILKQRPAEATVLAYKGALFRFKIRISNFKHFFWQKKHQAR